MANKESAFPYDSVHSRLHERGMTLRDYFAARAMQAMVTSGFPRDEPDNIAKFSYRYADSMMKERAKDG